jgi:DNA-binding response OmpR family regulator
MARILVIDDDATLCEMFRHALEGAGYDVQIAYDGQEGIEHHRGAPADLVITDLFMPQIDGYDTIRELREVSPRVKIIAITAGEGDDLAKAKELGATRTFVKPINVQEFLDTVEEIL